MYDYVVDVKKKPISDFGLNIGIRNIVSIEYSMNIQVNH